ncbi:MAG: hypothetical protein H7Z12_10525 [Rhodospirillaceae bacterium]|nr:hypothetical protein [Rhodospirillales bacterium]
MLEDLRAALLIRLSEVAPGLAVSDFGDAVGFWTERVDFNRDSPLVYADWPLVTGFEGHVIGEVIADLADGVGAPLIASLHTKRLRVDPPADDSASSNAYGIIAQLVSREDGSIEGVNALVTQLRFKITGGVYRFDPEPAPAQQSEEDDV